jgi:O-methyltransferase
MHPLAARLPRRFRRALQTARLSSTARRVKRRHLTYLSPVKLRSLEDCCTQVRTVPGDVIECGVALGGSGILLAKLLPDRRFDGYDVFGMIPPPTDEDDESSHERYRTIAEGRSSGLGGDTYYGYVPDLLDEVRRSFAEFSVAADGERVSLHRGLFADTLHVGRPIAFAHIDCDWYEPVRLCLERICPHVTPGGIVVLDDYFDYGGAARATDEYLAGHPELTVLRDREHRVLLKTRAAEVPVTAEAGRFARRGSAPQPRGA